MKINFNLRTKSSTKETPINIVIRYKPKQRLVYPAQLTISPKYWHGKRQRAKEAIVFSNPKYDNYEKFNARLDTLENSIKEVFTDYERWNNMVPTPDKLRELLDIKLQRKAIAPSSTFFDFIAQYTEDSHTRVNERSQTFISEWTRKQYRQLLNILNEYAKSKGKTSVNYEDITDDFCTDFTRYLISKKRLANNTIGGHIKNIKVILNAATAKGLNTRLDYKRFKVLKENTPSIYLDIQELEAMYQLDLTATPGLERVRDLFIISCWTALRFGDISRLSTEHIKGNNIEIISSKTKKLVVIPILHPVDEILLKYNYQLPKALSNQKTNEALKEIAKMVKQLHANFKTEITRAGVKEVKLRQRWELVTTHTGRRSCCTNLHDKGVPVKFIMALSGHATEKDFYRYIKTEPRNAANIIRDHFAKQPAHLKAV